MTSCPSGPMRQVINVLFAGYLSHTVNQWKSLIIPLAVDILLSLGMDRYHPSFSPFYPSDSSAVIPQLLSLPVCPSLNPCVCVSTFLCEKGLLSLPLPVLSLSRSVIPMHGESV